MISPVLPTYAPPADIQITHGDGAYLYTADGRQLLDFYAGIGVNALGHCHPHLVEALRAQAGSLWHLSNAYQIPGQRDLAQRFVDASFADTVFFCNSGAEAWEAGLKVIRRYFHAKGQPERYRVITFEGCFHGRTMGAISAAKKAKLTEGFGPLLEGFDLLPLGDLDAVRAAITPQTASLHVEPVQGEGGLTAMPQGFLQGLRQLCDEHGLLLFLDEVQCGAGRTGKFLAHEWYGLRPDVVCMAKGIGGGFPLGACLMTEEAASGMTVGSHGTTYGGNPLAMAVGHAVLDIMLAEGFMDGVVAIATELRAALDEAHTRHHGVIAGVRGMGLMIGLQVREPYVNTDLIQALRDNNVLTVPAADNVVRLLPPLTITSAHVSQFAEALDRAITSLPSPAAVDPQQGAA